MNQRAFESASLADLYHAIDRKRRRRNRAIALAVAFLIGLLVRALV